MKCEYALYWYRFSKLVNAGKKKLLISQELLYRFFAKLIIAAALIFDRCCFSQSFKPGTGRLAP